MDVLAVGHDILEITHSSVFLTRAWRACSLRYHDSMHSSIFAAIRKATESSIFVAGLIAIATVPALAMGGGGGGGGGGPQGQHMKGITGSGVGTGSVTCTGSNCSQTANGNFLGVGIGNGSFSVALNFSSVNPIDNGSGGSCYGASGTILLTAANGGSVTLGDVGLLCEVGASSRPTTFNGSYIIQNSTGKLSNSAGAGSTVLAIDASGNAYLNLNGAMGIGMGGGGMGGGGGGMGGM